MVEPRARWSRGRLYLGLAALIVFAIVGWGLLRPNGRGNWSGEADVAIVVRVVDQQWDGVPGARIELVNAETSTSIVEQSAVTDNLGYALLTHTFQAGGSFGEGWTETKISVHRHFLRATVDGIAPMEEPIGRHMPRDTKDSPSPNTVTVVFQLKGDE